MMTLSPPPLGACASDVATRFDANGARSLGLAALVVLLFLRNLRSTLVVAAVIPVSLLAAVAVINLLGYTFNTMTLLGLLLLIGVVDDAIVVLESIYRHTGETGAGVLKATLEGAQEVVFAVTARSVARP